MDFPDAPQAHADTGLADTGPGDVSRRRFLQGAAATAALASTVALPRPAAAAAGSEVGYTFTAATNGAATLAPDGAVVAEVQGVLWSVPRSGGTATPLTPADLEPTRPVFSPDGSLLAVCAYRGGAFHLWTLRPDGSDLTQRTEGPWDDRGPAWSPDGRRIAFASERGGDPVTGSPYRIWVLDLDSGALTRLTGVPEQNGPHQDGRWEDFDPTWSPDGERVLFVRARVLPAAAGLDARTVASVRADGTGPVTTEYAEERTGTQLAAPALSPAGRLAVLRTTPAPSASCTLMVAGAAVAVAGDVHPVPPRWTGPDELLLTVDGEFRLVRPEQPERYEAIPFRGELSVDRPRYRAKRYDLDPGGSRPVRALHLPALSPDGRRVAFGALNSLWLADTSGGRPPRRLVRSEATRYALAPSWAPDGRSLLYSDDRDGLHAVHRRDLDSGREEVLVGGGRVHPALSPDGRRLATLDMAYNLMVLDLDSGEERKVAAPLGAGGAPGRPSWSPDGRHIALCDLARLNQRFREGYNVIRIVDVADVADGSSRLHALAPHQSLSDRYGSGPVWSPDGRHFALVAESALWLLPIRPDGTPDGTPKLLGDEPADHPTWSADGRRILYQSAGRLRLVDIATGVARTVRVPLDHRRPTPADTVVHAGRLWDGTGGDDSVREDVDLVISGGRITAVEPHRPGRAAERRVDASAHTVLPGLWDAHTHPWQATYGGRQTALQLAYGITTAVSFGGFAYEQARLREAVAAGELAGPRLLTTGELLDGPRPSYGMSRAHTTKAGLRRSLRRGATLEWDFVKTYVRAPGWVMAEAARFAHEELGVRAGSHLLSPGMQLGQDLTTHLQATQRQEFGRSLTAGGRSAQDVTEIYTHGDFHLVATPFTAAPLVGADPALARDERVTRLMPPWDVATVEAAAGKPPTEAQLATIRSEVQIYHRILSAGGLVALGTDQPLVAVGLHLHLALRALHRYGLSPAEALRTATVLPARAFGAEQDLGTLQAGRFADLVVVDGDPFTDFDSLVRTESVLRGGVPYTRRELVAAFPEPTPRRLDAATREHWQEVGERMRRGSCCDLSH
ncbi:amidohydrolase family protein [Streptomyces cavernicola]|uniref:Amidohydrolase family protein n=1 Tax=Streptomyces cavernicola TaxID=3043613 RepID=A0ABT6S6X9_9ACTN|nr:amidohydrolase family protein [Streptomyces sp. B-S-A6]MDI3403857.1 amidohydrolase family protein [Streptomyces sp. B-S-A6]